MPLYSFSCSGCHSNWDQLLKIDNRDFPVDQPCQKCGKVGTVTKDVAAPLPVDPYLIQGTQSSQIPGDFREVMTRIGRAHPGSKLAERYR